MKHRLKSASAAKASAPALSACQSWWLFAAGMVASLPLLPHLPLWLVAAVALCNLGRAWQIATRRALPAHWLLLALALAGSAGIYAQYRMLFGQYPGIALLFLFLALKQLEARSARDGFTVVLLAYFVLLTGYLHSQSIPTALATAVAAIIVTATLAALNDDRPAPQRLLGLSARMLAQSVPFLLILFVLFPRVSGPLWGLPRDAHSALSGLSDSMSPGSIGNLSLSDAIAFRARFTGDSPKRSQLYWRGPVLTRFDGRTWRPALFTLHPTLAYDPGATHAGDIRYEITLEPHNKAWLFALELPVRLPPESLAASDYQTQARTPVIQRLRYEAVSRPDFAAGADESPRVLAAARQLPPAGNPRIRALAGEWRSRHAAAADPEQAILDDAIRFFLGQGLTYTLTPPLLGENSIDEFLFETKLGFCEHFSGSFAFTLRAAGLPARVVTGYQGGELNEFDGTLVVHQYDAHAWTEVWLSGRGWRRIDPTAVSAPARIETNLAAAVPAGDPLPAAIRPDLRWLRDLRLRWDAAANAWNQWVLGYGPQRQRDFLLRLGMPEPDWRAMTSALTLLSGLVMMALIAWAIRQRRQVDPAQAVWLRLGDRLARRGLARQPWEGPHDYAMRVGAARPDLAAELAAIADLYTRIRYGGCAPLIDTLRRRAAAFRP